MLKNGKISGFSQSGADRKNKNNICYTAKKLKFVYVKFVF